LYRRGGGGEETKKEVKEVKKKLRQKRGIKNEQKKGKGRKNI
jgi:hypothetical protein